jgi:hypothetical protein
MFETVTRQMGEVIPECGDRGLMRALVRVGLPFRWEIRWQQRHVLTRKTWVHSTAPREKQGPQARLVASLVRGQPLALSEGPFAQHLNPPPTSSTSQNNKTNHPHHSDFHSDFRRDFLFLFPNSSQLLTTVPTWAFLLHHIIENGHRGKCMPARPLDSARFRRFALGDMACTPVMAVGTARSMTVTHFRV